MDGIPTFLSLNLELTRMASFSSVLSFESLAIKIKDCKGINFKGITLSKLSVTMAVLAQIWNKC